MKELIGKLSRGIIEYDLPEAEVSVTSIEKNIEAGTNFRGSFDVFCKKERKLKGIVYSTNEYLKIINNQFIGISNKIEYEVNVDKLEEGDTVTGRINIVSNGGEIFIPFNIKIEPEGLPSSIGTINNLFHFMNLVKQEYDEALKMFLSPEFERIILKDNIADLCMYRGLIRGNSKKRALEEFIISINKKQKVEFEISDTEREYDSLSESYGDILLLSRNTWGYLDINVAVDGDFITDFKTKITDEDFAGNNYEFGYLIDITRLHDGMNYGKIIFTSINQCVECRISVDNIKEYDISLREVNKCLIGLNRCYLDFRMRKCQMDKWIEESLALLERARGFNDDNPFLKLLQAQVYLSRKADEEAKWLIDSVAESILDHKEDNIPLYCYYLYVRTLQKRELEQTIMATEVIRKYYESGYDKWELLWILLYIDPSYENNKSLKIARIKEQYKLGCHSTLMYYEALYVLNKQPALLRVINSFELQVLNFGSKYDAIDLRLAVQISELAMLEKNFRPLLFNILVKLYEKFENKVILTALLSVLIRGNMTESKYFKWYELGVLADIQVTRLFEYYIFSMPEDFAGTIPNTVLMYYVYNGSLLYEREAFFYSIIINNKEKQPNIYKNYVESIERFALEKLRTGEMNKYLSVIYGDILKPSMITDENEKMLPQIFNTWELTCDNDQIKEAIVLHKEINGENVYPISRGSAYINIYTEDAIILFRDIYNNIYLKSIDYKLERLVDSRDLSDVITAANEDNLYVMAKECEQSLKYHKRVKSGAVLFKGIMEREEFREEYKDYVLQDIIEYYSENYDGEELEDYLRSINVERLSRKSRIEVIELMITRGMYDEAGRYLLKYGTQGIDARRVLKYCTYILRFGDMSEEEHLLEYCNYAFKKGKYNEIVLEYLCTYYNGTTKEMMEMWRVSKEFSFESRDLEERLIAQMLFSRTNITSISTIYDSYYKKGTVKIIKNAYLFYESYVYFVKEGPVDDMYFKHLEDELILNDTIPDICKCAYLLYYSKRQTIKDNTKEICENAIHYLEKKGIIFDYYKLFGKWFKLSGNILDKTTVVYRTEPKDKVMINYYIETGNLKPKEYVSEEMLPVFNGMYTKSLTLFYGEKMKYYIMEMSGEESTLTESQEHELDDRSVDINNSRFGRFNDILICRELKEENIVNDLAREYYISNELAKRLFG